MKLTKKASASSDLLGASTVASTVAWPASIMARRGPEGYVLVQPPLMGRDARRPSRTESFAKLMPAIPFAQGGEYFSSSAGW